MRPPPRRKRAALEALIEAQLAPVQDISYVVCHDAYQYFEVRFGVAPTGALALGEAPIPAIFGDTIGHGVLDPLGSGHTPGADLDPAVLTGMADALVDCLGGQS